MATASQFEIVLSFKAVMEGLNTYVNAYKTRMAEVEAFNRRIMNGGAAIQQALGQLGAVLGGAALVKYAKDAAEADRVQQQFLRTLQRVGESGAASALNAQATALQRVTHYSDEAVTTVQRLLVNAGLSAGQTQDLTELVLDFAQETGQGAESAAALISRTLRGQTDELGRYNIKLDTSKGKVDALREALSRYAGGAARGAVADVTARENAARFADATENLGRALNRVVVPAMEQLVPLIERVATIISSLAEVIAPMAPVIGALGQKLLLVLGAFGALKVAMTGVMLLINPMRAGFVLLAGMSLVELSNILAVCTRGMGLMGTASYLLNDAMASMAGRLRLLAVGAALAGSALAGWQLGRIINEIQVGGMAIKDWVAIAIVWVGDKFSGILAGLRTAWAVTKNAGQDFWSGLKLATIHGVISIVEAWNRLPFGQKLKVDLAPLRQEFDTTVAHLLGSDERLRREVDGIQAERAAKLRENVELMTYLADQGKAASAVLSQVATAEAAAGGAGGGKDLNSERFGVEQGELFALQTKMLQAQLAGNQAEVDRLADLIQEKSFKQELLALEERGGALVADRLRVIIDARNKARQQAADEIIFQRMLGEQEIRRAAIEADRLLSTQEKQRQVNALLGEQNRLIEAKIAQNELQLGAGTTDEEKGRLLQEIATLRKQIADNLRTQQATRELTPTEGAVQGSKSFLSSLGTMADNVADSIQGGLNSGLQATSNLLYDIVTQSKTFGDAWRGAILSVAQSFGRMATDMVARMIWRATIERGLTALGVTTHIVGEQTKTAASSTGFFTRIALRVKEAMADVYAGAVAAFKAMAGIPVIGPFLGAAALAGALALGIGLVGKIGGHAKGGIVQGGRQLSWLNEEGTEGVIRAPSVRKFGAGFIESLNAGILDMSALPESVVSGMPAAAGASARGGGSGGSGARGAGSRQMLIVPVFDVSEVSREMRRHPDHEAHIVDVVRRRRGEIMDS